MKVYVGTSGWLYDWNLDGDFKWYVRNSGLNAIELNASYYRFPYRNQVISWSKAGKDLRWSIKVHRSITHYRKLSLEAYNIWVKFHKLFEPLEDIIDFYLFQMPPTYVKNVKNVEKIINFVRKADLRGKVAIEFRHESWFNKDTVDLCRKLEITLVSIDSPIASWIIRSNDTVYLRMHGRGDWYVYDYNVEELRDLTARIYSLNPGRVYVFFNNNHWMLENARIMLNILKSTCKRC